MLAGLIGGGAVLAASCWVETRVADPMFEMRLFWIRPFSAGNLAGWLASVARGGLQFMLIIWLQEIWLPLHGFRFESTPLWAGIYLLPLTIAFLITGPISGYLSDRYGARAFATAGLLVVAASFLGLLLIPANFPYWLFGVFIAINGLGSGFFSSPNTTAIMNSVPANRRGVAAGMRATFFNSGTSLSIGICFSLMIVGLASTLPHTLTAGLEAHHVPAAVAQRIGDLPPVGSLFAAFLGFNPIRSLLGPCVLAHLPPADAQALVGKEFFPTLISAPFHHGLVVVFATAIVMSLVGAGASLLHGGRYLHEEATADAARGQAVPTVGRQRARRRHWVVALTSCRAVARGTSAPAPEVARVAADLRLVVGRLARRLRGYAPSGLPPSQLSALANVDEHGPLRLSDLAVVEASTCSL